MPEKTRNPFPCPECGYEPTYVKNTMYEKGTYRIVRTRKCELCEKSFFTIQEREVVLTQSKVNWPQRFDRAKLVTLENNELKFIKTHD